MFWLGDTDICTDEVNHMKGFAPKTVDHELTINPIRIGGKGIEIGMKDFKVAIQSSLLILNADCLKNNSILIGSKRMKDLTSTQLVDESNMNILGD